MLLNGPLRMDGAELKLGVQKTDIAGFLPYNLV